MPKWELETLGAIVERDVWREIARAGSQERIIEEARRGADLVLLVPTALPDHLGEAYLFRNGFDPYLFIKWGTAVDTVAPGEPIPERFLVHGRIALYSVEYRGEFEPMLVPREVKR